MTPLQCHTRLVRVSGDQTPAQGGGDNRERGSIFIWILVAISLFAALSYAMSQGSRSSVSLMTDTQARLYATEIIAYGDDIRQAVQRLRLRGVPDTGLSFENDVFMRNNGTLLHTASLYPQCTSNNCKIFHIEGGGVTPQYTPKGSAENPEIPNNPLSSRAGTWSLHVACMDGIGSPERDLIVLSGFIKKNVCIQINNLLGVENPNSRPPSFNYGVPGGGYTGTFGSPTGTFANGAITNMRSYCYEITSRPGVYSYMTVLIAR